jgi:hypothetical protein
VEHGGDEVSPSAACDDRSGKVADCLADNVSERVRDPVRVGNRPKRLELGDMAKVSADREVRRSLVKIA